MRKLAYIPLLSTLLIASVASAAVAYQWRDVATLVGGATQAITLTWEVDTSKGSQADYYEVISGWLERPSRSVTKKILPGEVRVTSTANATIKAVNVDLRLPGPGHFNFQARNCLNPKPPATTPTCTSWVNSFDTQYARVSGQSRAWWVYGYLEPLPPPVVQ